MAVCDSLGLTYTPAAAFEALRTEGPISSPSMHESERVTHGKSRSGDNEALADPASTGDGACRAIDHSRHRYLHLVPRAWDAARPLGGHHGAFGDPEQRRRFAQG